jgi:hypothetical protein
LKLQFVKSLKSKFPKSLIDFNSLIPVIEGKQRNTYKKKLAEKYNCIHRIFHIHEQKKKTNYPEMPPICTAFTQPKNNRS